MSNEKADRIKDFYKSFKQENGYYPSQAVIAASVSNPNGGTGITRQAVAKYFKKNEKALKKIPEYKRYYIDKVNQPV